MTSKHTAYEALQIVQELLTFAERAIALRMRSENPKVSEAEIETAIAKWYQERPGAEKGDCGGDVRERFLE
jgi:hypothetical protein